MMRYKIILVLMLCLLILQFCSDPSSVDDKYVVRTLIDEYWGEGEFTFFWDGTDNKNKPLPAGTYYVRMWTRDYSHQIELTAVDGTFQAYNDSTRYFPTTTLITLLSENHPNPFIITEGTNIPFKLAESTHLQLTVRNHE